MKKIQEELLSVIKKQNTLLDELVELSKKELEILTENNLEELQKMTSLLEKKGREMALLEQKRQEIIAHIEKDLGEEIEHLKELYKYLDSHVKEELENISSQMVKKHSELTEIQETNKLLLKQGLKYTKKILTAVAGNTPTTYGKTGTMEKELKVSTIDKNV